MKSIEIRSVAAGIGLVATLCAGAAPKTPDAVLIGAGDIGHCTSTGDDKMAATVEKMLKVQPKAVVFTAGDNAYPDGTTEDFENCFAPSWGRFKNDIALPAPGNHEYHKSISAKPYFRYFGKVAEGINGKGYYAKNFGNWRAYVLNSELGGQDKLKQEAWLKADLKQHPTQYKAAIMHRPLFSSGTVHGTGDKQMKPYWQMLAQDTRAKLVITGHDHHAEVFAQQSPDGKKNDKGLRQVIIGTGGASLYKTGDPLPNSEFVYNKTPAVLELALHTDGSYEGKIVTVQEHTVYTFNS